MNAHDINPEPSTRQSLIKGYISVLVAVVCCIMSITSSQVAGNKTSIFLANIFRFAFDMIVSTLCVVIRKHSIVVQKSDICKLVSAACLNYLYTTLFYLAAPLLPVGNMDGVYAGLYIAFTTTVDVVRKQVSRSFIFTAALAITGLLLLTQPWHFSDDVKIPPCDYLDNNYSFIFHTNESSYPRNPSKFSLNSILGINSLLLGYLMVTCATISLTVADNLTFSLLQTYPFWSLILWNGVIQFGITGTILAGLGLSNTSNLSFPTGCACLGFTVVFIIAMTTSHLMNFVPLVYLPVSTGGMVFPIATIGLYIIQRTALKIFHPGNANMMEVFGIICVVVASLASPIITFFSK